MATAGIFNRRIFNAPIFNTATPDIAPTGPPEFPWRLFRGVVIGKKLERQGELLRLTLDLEDYNRLTGGIAVGAPLWGNFRHETDPEPDGTDIAIDALAQTAGVQATAEFYRNKFDQYWNVFGADPAPVFDFVTWIDDVSGPGDTLLPDFATAQTDWANFSNTVLAYIGQHAAAWIDPELNLHLTRLAQFGELSDYAHAAPYEIDEDAGSALGTGNILMPQALNVDVDYVKALSRVFFTAGTPEASKWEMPLAGFRAWAGEGYADAHAAIVPADTDAIAEYELSKTYKNQITGTAVIQVGFEGWRAGQTVIVTSSRLSQDDCTLDHTPTIIQSVAGRLVGPGTGLSISSYDHGDIGALIANWQSLAFAESINGAEKATLVVEIVDPDQTLDIRAFDDIIIETDGTADIEYTLTWGDTEAGDIAKAQEGFKIPITDPKTILPVYHFIIDVPDGHGPWENSGQTFPVVANLVDFAGKPVALFGVPLFWILYQWSDDAKTVPGTGFALTDSTGTTNESGKSYNGITWTDGGTAINYEIVAQALPY